MACDTAHRRAPSCTVVAFSFRSMLRRRPAAEARAGSLSSPPSFSCTTSHTAHPRRRGLGGAHVSDYAADSTELVLVRLTALYLRSEP
jgi:hypothetical protein